MVDMNGGFNGYQTDMTRVWSIGTLPQIAYDAHRCSRDILRDLENSPHPELRSENCTGARAALRKMPE